jgi:dienelactone hydrolase
VLVDLVRVTTADGVRLDGTYQAPAGAAAAAPVDAFCLVHGTGGSFYTSALFDELTDWLLGRGHGVLRVNTRGHDGISTAATQEGGRRQGAAYEVVGDCRHDVAAWVAWLRERAGPRVGLVGHSVGAVKCLYALAQGAPPAVACLLALSPPRLSYSAFCSGPRAAEFLEAYGLAESHVRAGRPGALLDVSLPLPLVISAAGYLDKYGPEERYNLVPLLRVVPCPTLVTFGGREVEDNVAFQGLPEELARVSARRPRVRVETLAGADHFYTDARPELLARVEGWLAGLGDA